MRVCCFTLHWELPLISSIYSILFHFRKCKIGLYLTQPFGCMSPMTKGHPKARDTQGLLCSLSQQTALNKCKTSPQRRKENNCELLLSFCAPAPSISFSSLDLCLKHRHRSVFQQHNCLFCLHLRKHCDCAYSQATSYRWPTERGCRSFVKL